MPCLGILSAGDDFCTNVGHGLRRAMRSPAWAFPSAPSWIERHHSWPNSRSRSSHTSWDHCATPTTQPASYLDDGWSPAPRQTSQRSWRMRRTRRTLQRKTRPPAQKHRVSTMAENKVIDLKAVARNMPNLNVLLCYCNLLSLYGFHYAVYCRTSKVVCLQNNGK